MSVRFNPHGRLIIVPVRLFGPSSDFVVRLALDTGATTTLIDPEVLRNLGYAPEESTKSAEIVTASGREIARRVEVRKLQALGEIREDFSIYTHSIPDGIGIRGLLGLDFVRGRKLTVDFRVGTIGLD